MLKRFYSWFLQKTARPEDRGGVSAGYWQGKIRGLALGSLDNNERRILDIGCGEGLLLRDLIKINPSMEVVGIDLSMSQLEEARLKAVRSGAKAMRLCRADATVLPFRKDIFDKVIAINLVINMPSESMVEELIKESARVCKDGGAMVFDIRNSLSPLIFVKYKLAPFYDATIKAKGLRLIAFRPDRIEKMLRASGFGDIKKRTIGFPKGDLAPVVVFEARKRKRT